MTPCEKVEQDLTLAAAGALGGWRAWRAKLHSLSCKRCVELYKDVRGMHLALARAQPKIPLARRELSALASGLAIAAAVAVIVVAYVYFTADRHVPNPNPTLRPMQRGVTPDQSEWGTGSEIPR